MADLNDTIHGSLEGLSKTDRPHRIFAAIEENGFRPPRDNLQGIKTQAASSIGKELMLNAWRKTRRHNEQVNNILQRHNSQLRLTEAELQAVEALVEKKFETFDRAVTEIPTLKGEIMTMRMMIPQITQEMEAKAIKYKEKIAKEKELANELQGQLYHAETIASSRKMDLNNQRDICGQMSTELEAAIDKVKILKEELHKKEETVASLEELHQKEPGEKVASDELAQRLEDIKYRQVTLQDEIDKATRTKQELQILNDDYERKIRLTEDKISEINQELTLRAIEHDDRMQRSQHRLCQALEERRRLGEMIEKNKQRSLRNIVVGMITKVGSFPIRLIMALSEPFRQ